MCMNKTVFCGNCRDTIIGDDTSTSYQNYQHTYTEYFTHISSAFPRSTAAQLAEVLLLGRVSSPVCQWA